MPKSPTSPRGRALLPLQDLATSATCKLISSSCRRIEKKCPNRPRLTAYDSDFCKKGVKSVQKLCIENIAPLLWDTVFAEVIEEYHSCDDVRLLYGVFLHDEVYMRSGKFKVPRLPYCNPRYSNDENTRRMFDNHVAFWVRCAPMLRGIRELDLTDVSNEKIIHAFGESCRALRTIRLNRVTSGIVQFVLRHLKNLLRLDCVVDAGRKSRNKMFRIVDTLTLRSLKLRTQRVDIFIEFMDHCPNLVELDIARWGNVTTCRTVFLTLTSSPQNLSSLKLHYFLIQPDVIQGYISCKGAHITDIHLHSCSTVGSVEAFLVILSKCSNLARLSLRNLSGDVQTISPSPQLSFIKLESLAIRGEYQISQTLALAKMCLDCTSQLKEFVLEIGEPDFYINTSPTEDIENWLKEQCRHPRMKNLLKMTLNFLQGDGIMVRVACRLLNACPGVACLELQPITGMVQRFLAQMREEQELRRLRRCEQ